jgi:predicted transcriptional regulator of viral defense system
VCQPTPENTYEAGTPDQRVAEMAARQWGVLSLAELRACGLTDNRVATRVAAGRLHRVHRGVYAVGHAALTMRGRFLAAVKACGDGAVLSHVSAAALWELLPLDEARPPDVIARTDRRSVASPPTEPAGRRRPSATTTSPSPRPRAR